MRLRHLAVLLFAPLFIGASCAATYGPKDPVCGYNTPCQTGGCCDRTWVCGDGTNGCFADACCSPPYQGNTEWLQSHPRPVKPRSYPESRN